ncbi:SIS domain-containing protein [Priestia filamentosa]|uniref:SIS domain-containing protein n=1 Tax=Priestia filamentosa TaxID=1402861 RepID=UPI003979F6B7
MSNQYIEEIKALLYKVEKQEKTIIQEAATQIVNSINSQGIIHLFGCGHSHMLTEELFYRSGGLAPIHPIFIEELMLHKGASRSSQLERQNQYAHTFMKEQDIRSGDICIVVSTSGVNPVPIDVALLAKEKGAYVIGLTSPIYAKSRPSRHESGHYLHDVVDVVLDNHIPKGDVLLNKNNIKFGSGSTIIGAIILNTLFSEVIEIMLQAGLTPPIFQSGNMEGADNHNKHLIAQYKERIPFL